MPQQFFEEPIEQSEIKGDIAARYFQTWARIMIAVALKRGRDTEVGYIELFSGPGQYKNGKPATPRRILEAAVKDKMIADRLNAVFVEERADFVAILNQVIQQTEGISSLRQKPRVLQCDVATDVEQVLGAVGASPTFSFIDPFGYDGLSLTLIKSLMSDWGSDCLFFFNYNRINAAIMNRKVAEQINALFGRERADRMRTELRRDEPANREEYIVDEMVDALKVSCNAYVLPFRFISERQHRTSHYLFFVSRDVLGLIKMKEIMAKYSSSTEQGVPSMEHDPHYTGQMYLDPFRPEPILKLKHDLVSDFAGRTLSVENVIKQHTWKTRCLTKNYKDALLELEAEGIIVVDPPASERRKSKGRPTLADKKMITFPK
jgi:three-Cys-motif partner protein